MHDFETWTGSSSQATPPSTASGAAADQKDELELKAPRMRVAALRFRESAVPSLTRSES